MDMDLRATLGNLGEPFGMGQNLNLEAHTHTHIHILTYPFC